MHWHWSGVFLVGHRELWWKLWASQVSWCESARMKFVMRNILDMQSRLFNFTLETYEATCFALDHLRVYPLYYYGERRLYWTVCCPHCCHIYAYLRVDVHLNADDHDDISDLHA